MISDAQTLVERARLYSQSHRLMYDEAVDIKVLSERIANIQQLYTQRSWIRPFGVSIIFGGVDKTGPKVFKTDPSGAYRGYKAISTGAGSETVMKVLEEEYRNNITLEKGINLAVKCLSKAIEEKLEAEKIRIAIVTTETKKFRKFTNAEISQYIKGKHLN